MRMLLVTRRGERSRTRARSRRCLIGRGDLEALGAVGAVGGGQDGGRVQDDAAAEVHVVDEDGDDLVRILMWDILVVAVVGYPLHGERVDVVRVLDEQVGEYDDAVLHAAIFVDPWDTLDRDRTRSAAGLLCGGNAFTFALRRFIM